MEEKNLKYSVVEMNGTTMNGPSVNGHVNNLIESERDVFLKKVFELLLVEGVAKGTDVNSKIVNFHHPKDLQTLLDLDLKDDGESDDRLLEFCKDAIKYSVKTGHPHFFNQLYSGLDQYGLAGSWLSDTVNTSQYTFEVAPVFTLMEQVVLSKMAEVVGYESHDGIFCPGGSISNMYGINIARFKMFPEVKIEGMHALPKICLFTSNHGHYSIKKGAALLGIGLSNIISVPCNKEGKMIPKELERLVLQSKEKGCTPFFVNATAGTTVAGAYDPLEEIADICQKYGMWMHVDCCWGGGALMSLKYKHLLKGIDRSDSLAWNPHKMMGTPLQCCAFITKYENLLQECHCSNAGYLFQQDKFYDVAYDTGDKSIQCGRKVDVFKLWLMWKAKGNKGFEQGINNAFDNARYFTELLKARKGFRVVFPEPECTNVCFWYIPPCLRGKEETPEWQKQLAKVAPAIKERMVHEGTLLIGYQPLEEYVNFFRLVVSNLELDHKHMEFVICEIERLSESIYQDC